MAARSIKALPIGLLLVLAGSGTALADKIDGDWCSADGRHMSIEGPAITTPGGSAIAGNYSRHAFRYTIPSNEAHAGSPVNMLLLNEFTVHLTVGADASAPVEVWNRCSKPIS
jgi:hypothetical protein